MKWFRIKALLLKHYYTSINSLDRIFDIFFWPLMGVLLWSFATYYVEDLAQNNFIIAVFLGGAVMWTFLQRADNDITFYILADFWNGNLFNLFSSPVKESEIVVSTAIVGLIRSMISFIVMVVFVFFLRDFNMLQMGLVPMAMSILALLLFGWTVGIFILSLIFRYGTRIQVFAWSVAWLIQPFSAVFYPLDSLPLWIQKISLWLPSTYVFEALRHAIRTQEVLWDYYLRSIILTIGLFIIACFFFKRSMMYAKRTGLLTRPNP